ncbi:hypothetical protein D9757_011259 [Collybiopsis confluens]|uniref:Glucose-methanol-choline oxidoreductase N-terminal domain-containing protein n=1 Tax=Collybiopsis confluens TaxID=2823264 RepID=A0A8H5GNC4_9AGAR|nr:hypothetical protein D9757_011259 [Collybiopsis confluens]
MPKTKRRHHRPPRVEILHGRNTFTNVSSSTPKQRQLKRRGFSEAKNRLYELLQDIGAPFEVITGAPILQGQQEAAYMVPSSTDNPTLLHLEYAFGFQEYTLAVHSKWNIAPMNQLHHQTLDRHGAFLLPGQDSINYMKDKIKAITRARMMPLGTTNRGPDTGWGSIDPGLEWAMIRHCGQPEVALHKYAFIPFGFVFNDSSSRPPPPICQWSTQTASYPYIDMPEIESHLSPFLVLANCHKKYTIWQAKLANLPEAPEESLYLAEDDLVLPRVAPFLHHPDRIRRFRGMIELFTMLRVLEYSQRNHPSGMPPAPDPDVFMSSPPSSTRFSSSSSFSGPSHRSTASGRHHRYLLSSHAEQEANGLAFVSVHPREHEPRCVVAGRLAFADPNLKVMLIEGGANNRDDPWVYRPGIYARNMQNDGINEKATFYTDTMASSYLRGRQSIVPCANILGGGSSINFQMYTRASASDWDDFKTEGWTAKDLLPLMKRLENYQKPTNNDTHGYDGPIAISNGGSITSLAHDFLRASDAIRIPFSMISRILTPATLRKSGPNTLTGTLDDEATPLPLTFTASWKPVPGKTPWLSFILVADVGDFFQRTNARVNRVIFEGNKAVGVAYVPARNRAHGGQLKETIVKARKYVVISSGTLGTPQILERSGVGDSKLLQKLDIKVVSDLPGVGEQYQDHYTTLSIFRVSKRELDH